MAATKKAKKSSTKKSKGAGSQLTGTDDDKLTSLDTTETSMTEISAARGDKGSALSASPETTAALDGETKEEKQEEDTSDYGKLSRSGYGLNEDKVDGRRWVGISYAVDPAEKDKGHIVTFTPIQEVRPWTGLQVRPKSGEPFAVPEVGKDATPSFWLGLMIPGTKKNFIEA
jgi:hypothetical protein